MRARISKTAKFKLSDLYWFLLVILPLIDSLNGMINGGGNEEGLSLGIIYRIVVLITAICLWCKSGLLKTNFGVGIAFLAVLCVSTIVSYDHIESYLPIVFKLLLPIILILSNESQARKGNLKYDFIKCLFNVWVWLFPLSMIIPYIFGYGFQTYGSVGYKGFYYAQNDIGFVLALLYLYSVYDLLEKFKLKKIIVIVALLGSNLMLGLKSNYLFIVVITLFYALSINKKKKVNFGKILSIVMIAIGILMIFNIYSNEIQQIKDRWIYFYGGRNSDISFWTSSRWDRVFPSYLWLINKLGVFGFLFGSGIEYTFHAGVNNIIEMDFLDIFFQTGIIGCILVYGFYFKVQKKYKSKGFFLWGFLLALISSCLAGHIMESALSGMIFASLCSGPIFAYYEEKANGK